MCKACQRSDQLQAERPFSARPRGMHSSVPPVIGPPNKAPAKRVWRNVAGIPCFRASTSGSTSTFSLTMRSDRGRRADLRCRWARSARRARPGAGARPCASRRGGRRSAAAPPRPCPAPHASPPGSPPSPASPPARCPEVRICCQSISANLVAALASNAAHEPSPPRPAG